MWWGTHVEGSDAWWCYCTSPEPSWSSMCPQPPRSRGGMCSLTLPSCSSSPGDLPRCAVALGQPDSLAGVWAPRLCLRGFWWCYVAKRSILQQQSLFHIMGLCLLLHLHKLGGERDCYRQGEFVCLMFILHQSRRVLGTAARATRGFTYCFKSCEEQLLPISTHLIYWILNQGLIFFTLTVLPTPPK